MKAIDLINEVARQHYRVKVGKRYWFEYHCLESHSSADAKLWYKSHQQVTVLRLDSPGAGKDEFERSFNGHPAAYDIQFDDGFKHSATEDELLDSPDDFIRPDPPHEP